MEDFDIERGLDRIRKGEFSQPETQISPLSSLKHSIAHCFLAMDIDLQVIGESDEAAEDHLRSVTKGKGHGYYRCNLNHARCLAVGGQWCSLATGRSPEGSILSILMEVYDAENRGHERAWQDFPREWYLICEYLGVDRSEPFGEDKASPIVGFMGLLDGIIEAEAITHEAVSSVLDYFETKTWEIEKSDNVTIRIRTVHQWFSELNDTIAALRTAIGDKANGKTR